MGFLDDLGLLARHVPGDARNALKGLLGDMPLTKALRGESEVSANGLKNALMGMQVGPDAQGSYDAAMQIGPQAMGLLGKIVYHGSPHKFDKFDASKIGTGEGAQAYGHGVYLADAEDVAKGYQKTLAYKAFDLGPEAEKRGLKLTAGARGEFHRQASANTDPMRAARGLQNANISARDLPQEKLAELFDAFQKDGTGALYKADLPDEWIPKMLDWDKPLSQQSKEVQGAIKAVVPDIDRFGWVQGNKPVTDPEIVSRLEEMLKKRPAEVEAQGFRKANLFSEMSGKDIHYLLGGRAMGSSGMGEAALREAGIPGIRYLDGGSRPKNIVESRLLSIYEKNGGDATKAVDEFMRGVYETPKVKEKMRAQFLDQLKNAPTYNYVVFPGLEDKVKILERNGAPLDELLGLLGQ